MELRQQLEQERIEHNEIYAQQKDWLIQKPLTWESYYQQMSIPPHQGGSLYGLDHKIFLDTILDLLENYKSDDIHILDYGCGTGHLLIIAFPG